MSKLGMRASIKPAVSTPNQKVRHAINMILHKWPGVLTIKGK